jgi:cytochrome c oxidase cbb3-type subunit 3
MPAWPLGVTYTKGLLGIDQRQIVSRSLQQAALDRSAWTKRIEAESFGSIRNDPRLRKVVRDTGRALFGDNCAACHGINAGGGKGFPNLTTSAFLWGGNAEQIFETIRVGVNSAHPGARSSQMPAFGRDRVLQREDIDNATTYVQTLSDPSAAKEASAAAIEAGRKVFAANCSSCHGEDGKGNPEFGAPNLTDRVWLYGGDAETIYRTIWGGRQGHMPTWESRLTTLDRKILTLYLVDLREGTP